jgi:hypothetical protein
VEYNLTKLNEKLLAGCVLYSSSKKFGVGSTHSIKSCIRQTVRQLVFTVVQIQLIIQQSWSREWGTLVQPLKKPTVPTVLPHCQFLDKNKQLTSLSQHKLAFTERNMFMALNI